MLLLLLFTAAHAAHLGQELPFLPNSEKMNTSFFNATEKSEALARFFGEHEAAALEEQKNVLRSASQAMPNTPELRLDVVQAQAKMSQRMENTVVDRPTISQINAPIADYLYGGDIRLSPEDVKNLKAATEGITEKGTPKLGRKKRGAPVVTSKRWSKTQPIAFIFNNDIEEPDRVLIRTVFDQIAAVTCLSFKENGTDGTQLQFHRGGGCWSYIGNTHQDKQLISIDSGCNIMGIIAHEISHALGLDHTQNRKDRDAYVSVNDAAVNNAYRNNFAKLSDQQNDNFGVPYDYGSDMHYGAYDFSANGKAVIVAKDADYVNTMGQRKKLGFNDLKMINILYKCSEQCPTQIVCQNGGYPSPKDCNSCVCNDFFKGNNCEKHRFLVNITANKKVLGDAISIYNQKYDDALYKSGNNYNWEMFGKDPVKTIRAPEGSKIRVTINKLYAAYGQLGCYAGCPFVGIEIIDTEDRDLTNMGKIFCCSKDEGYSFVSKSNIVGYKAYASPGMPFEAEVQYSTVS